MNNFQWFTEITRLFAGVVVGIAGLLIGRYITRQKESRSLVFDFHKELNSMEMIKHRHTGGDLIRIYPNTKIEELLKIDRDKALSVFVIMRFYQRFWMAIKYKMINKRIAKDLFSANFYFWYYTYFEKNAIPQDWTSTDQIRDLSIWFSKNLSNHSALRDKYLDQRREMLSSLNSLNKENCISPE